MRAGFVHLGEGEWVRVDNIDAILEFEGYCDVITMAGRSYSYAGSANDLFELIGAVRDLVLGNNEASAA